VGLCLRHSTLDTRHPSHHAPRKTFSPLTSHVSPLPPSTLSPETGTQLLNVCLELRARVSDPSPRPSPLLRPPSDSGSQFMGRGHPPPQRILDRARTSNLQFAILNFQFSIPPPPQSTTPHLLFKVQGSLFKLPRLHRLLLRISTFGLRTSAFPRPPALSTTLRSGTSSPPATPARCITSKVPP
jgi:hypothetical protein